MAKKLTSALLAIAMILCCVTVAFAEEGTATLYNVYGDGMLFTQNKDAIFAGQGTPGSNIKVQLLNENSLPIRTGSAKTAQDGTFEVSFSAPAGGYKEYSVVLTQDGKEFAKLENVVFGELWLASGQSNMMYPLIQSKTGLEMFQKGETPNEWLRVFIEPAYPTYNGTNAIPVDPQNNIDGAAWTPVDNPAIFNMSAVAYFFAEEMMTELDMPIGIINTSLGGSSIASWLSREAIESDELLKNAYIENGVYKTRADWDENNINIYNDMTANYNLRTHAYRNFRPSGMIWYQGETDLIYQWSHNTYSYSFDAMQQMYTDMFDYDNGFFPIIYTQIAAYHYPPNDYVLPEWNINYTEIQSTQSDSRAMITLSDLPLTYIPELGVIHPQTKEPVGHRMAWAAQSMVYGKGDTHTAASLESSEIRDGSIYATFSNVGDGLVAVGSTLKGFAICGDDGIYVQAQAEIVSKDTVRIWSDEVSKPASATYAYEVSNMAANLFSSQNGEPLMPVSVFVTKNLNSAHYWSDKSWADSEADTVWHNLPDPQSAFFSVWESENAQVSIDSASAYSGTNGLSVKSSEKAFSIMPTQLFNIDGKEKPFTDIETDFSDYGKLSFYAKNNGSTDVTLDKMRIYINSVTWFSPAVENTSDSSYTIPADGKWHKITLDLDSLYLYGNECFFTFANEKLDYTFKYTFDFTGTDSDADISVDHFRFTPSDAESGTRFEANIADADNPLEFICAVFTTIIGFFFG